MSDSNGLQGFCYCLCLVISIVVFAIQSASESSKKSDISPDHNGSHVPLASCAYNFTTRAGEWKILDCAGDCKKKCGICDPSYDGCIGTKYCPVLCKDGTICDSAKGPYQSKFCKSGICLEDRCSPLPEPVRCSNIERHFHWTLTAAYSTYLVCGVVAGYLFNKWGRSDDVDSNTSLTMVYVVPSAVCLICSISFAAACAGGESMGKPRLITMSVMAFLSFLFVSSAGMNNLQAEKAKDLTKQLLAAYFLTFTADIMLSQINRVHSLLEAVDSDLYPFVATNKLCQPFESKFYASWNIISGGVFIISGPACVLFFDSVPHPLFTWPLWISWLVNVAFLGACKAEGHTLLVPYGITMCVLYFIVAVLCVLAIRNGERLTLAAAQEYIGLGKDKSASLQLNGPRTAVGFHAVGFALVCWSLYITNKVVSAQE